jgi:hypothetical protein
MPRRHALQCLDCEQQQFPCLTVRGPFKAYGDHKQATGAPGSPLMNVLHPEAVRVRKEAFSGDFQELL